MTYKKGKLTSMARTSLFLCFCLGLSLGLAAFPAFAYTPPNSAELETSAESFLMRPGVVIDPARAALYVMTADGVAAYNIEGDALWQSETAERPVGLFGDQLIALKDSGRIGKAEIVFLNVRNGEVLSTITADLPHGAGGWVTDRPHQSFTATTMVTGGEVLLSWTFSSRPLRGAPVVAGEETHQLQQLDGSLRLDPNTGSAQAIEASAPKRADRRFDLSAEERLPDVDGRQFRAGDDAHVLASQKTADPWNRYRWTILDRANNRVLGSVDRPTSAAAFFVSGTTLIHESAPFRRRLESGDFETHGLRLVAVELGSQKELWSLNIRDVVYRGSMPP